MSVAAQPAVRPGVGASFEAGAGLDMVSVDLGPPPPQMNQAAVSVVPLVTRVARVFVRTGGGSNPAFAKV